MAEPINLLFGLWIQMGRRKHKFCCICQVVPMCPHGMAHWCHLANTSEPSMFGWVDWSGGDTALCQITLTTCCSSYHCWVSLICILSLMLLLCPRY